MSLTLVSICYYCPIICTFNFCTDKHKQTKHRQTHKNTQTFRHTNKNTHTNKHTHNEEHPYKQTNTQTNILTHIHTHMSKTKQTQHYTTRNNKTQTIQYSSYSIFNLSLGCFKFSKVWIFDIFPIL